MNYATKNPEKPTVITEYFVGACSALIYQDIKH